MNGFFHALFFKHNRLQPARVIAAGFTAIVLAGAFVLMLPIASAQGVSTDFLTCMFTSTSASCVTGLIVVNTSEHWSTFGHTVILILIQVGGLGFMSIFTLYAMALHRHIGLRERMLLAQSIGMEDLGGIVGFIRRVLSITLLVEGAGALLLSSFFIPRFGLLRGAWYAVFHSVSAFCNAGIDLMGDSYARFPGEAVLLLTTCALIVIGGIGFFVWDDLLHTKQWKKLTLHTKLALSATAFLLAAGTLFYLAAERHNPGTLEALPPWQRLLGAFFQSVTSRTAGFNVMQQNLLSDDSKFFTTLLMLVGGSPGSTAGGVKTVTLAVMLTSVLAALRGKRELVLFRRSLPFQVAVNATSLVTIGFLLAFGSGMLLSFLNGLPLLDCLYEAASAYGTVGLTTGITAGLTVLSKWMLIILMLFGRLGVSTLGLALLMASSTENRIAHPKGRVLLG